MLDQVSAKAVDAVATLHALSHALQLLRKQSELNPVRLLTISLRFGGKVSQEGIGVDRMGSRSHRLTEPMAALVDGGDVL